MKRSRPLITGIVASIGMMALILDSETALSGAAEGIELCVKTVIPALFPFFVLSVLLTGTVMGTELTVLRPVGKLCGIPKGAEAILLTGLLGGYPVGAQCVSYAYKSNQLSKEDAQRMLGFCSNAGPAFLFGMSGLLFENKSVPILLWLIHVISAIITGILLPGRSANTSLSPIQRRITVGQALHKSLIITATVCGWVVIFRIILSFAKRWFLWLFPYTVQVLLTGILELTNGYLLLSAVENESLRFILASVFLGFGGLCVTLQTASVTSEAGLDLGYYFPGKLIQTVLSALLSTITAGLLFKTEHIPYSPAITIFAGLTLAIILLTKRKNSSSIPAQSVV